MSFVPKKQTYNARINEVVLGVVNSPVLELPKTGSNSVRIISILAALLAAAGVTLLITRRKKVQ